MTRAITVELSDKIYQQLRRASELARQPLDAIVEQSLRHSLSPVLDEIPADYQKDVLPLLQMSDAELFSEAQRVFPAGRWSEYEVLLDEKKAGPLSPAAQARFDDLRYQADVLMFRKSYAAVLLKRRGHPIPSLNNLPRPL